MAQQEDGVGAQVCRQATLRRMSCWKVPLHSGGAGGIPSGCVIFSCTVGGGKDAPNNEEIQSVPCGKSQLHPGSQEAGHCREDSR